MPGARRTTDRPGSLRSHGLDPLRADTFRFGLAGRLLIGVLVWAVPGWILWTMALHPGTVAFVWWLAMSPPLIAVAVAISVRLWRTPK